MLQSPTVATTAPRSILPGENEFGFGRATNEMGGRYASANAIVAAATQRKKRPRLSRFACDLSQRSAPSRAEAPGMAWLRPILTFTVQGARSDCRRLSPRTISRGDTMLPRSNVTARVPHRCRKAAPIWIGAQRRRPRRLRLPNSPRSMSELRTQPCSPRIEFC